MWFNFFVPAIRTCKTAYYAKTGFPLISVPTVICPIFEKQKLRPVIVFSGFLLHRQIFGLSSTNLYFTDTSMLIFSLSPFSFLLSLLHTHTHRHTRARTQTNKQMYEHFFLWIISNSTPAGLACEAFFFFFDINMNIRGLKLDYSGGGVNTRFWGKYTSPSASVLSCPFTLACPITV